MSYHHIFIDEECQKTLCGANASGDTHSENCDQYHIPCLTCNMIADKQNLCAECDHPKSEHPVDYGGGTACNRDFDADWDYEAERYFKCGGCDCPEFIERT